MQKTDEGPDCALYSCRGPSELDLIEEGSNEFRGLNRWLDLLGIERLDNLYQHLQGGLLYE